MIVHFRNEDEYVKALCPALAARGYVTQIHHDEQSNYVPDVSFSGNYVDGWLEVKWCDPAPTTLDAIKHYTKGQQFFLTDHGRRGSGHCYLLVGTPDMHVLIKWNRLEQFRAYKWGMTASLADITAKSMPDLMFEFERLVRIR